MILWPAEEPVPMTQMTDFKVNQKGHYEQKIEYETLGLHKGLPSD